MRKHLKQLTVRLRIDPGEAYIMNADDVIHDGASDVPDVPDVLTRPWVSVRHRVQAVHVAG